MMRCFFAIKSDCPAPFPHVSPQEIRRHVFSPLPQCKKLSTSPSDWNLLPFLCRTHLRRCHLHITVELCCDDAAMTTAKGIMALEALGILLEHLVPEVKAGQSVLSLVPAICRGPCRPYGSCPGSSQASIPKSASCTILHLWPAKARPSSACAARFYCNRAAKGLTTGVWDQTHKRTYGRTYGMYG